jgi:hypothetical protein
VFQSCGGRENYVIGDNVSIDDLFVNHLGAWWRLFRRIITVIRLPFEWESRNVAGGWKFTLKPSSTGMKKVW